MVANNSFSILQMMALKNDRIRDFLGLIKPPPDEAQIEVKKEINHDSWVLNFERITRSTVFFSDGIIIFNTKISSG